LGLGLFLGWVWEFWTDWGFLGRLGFLADWGFLDRLRFLAD